MSSDFAARITLDEWQEYQNLKANFHRYTDSYAREQQTLIARIDHLQIENAALHDKLLTQKQYCDVQGKRGMDDAGVQSESMARRLSRRASLFDGTWTNSLQSTMVSPYPPTIFSPSVSISRARKPTLAVTVPDRMPPSLSWSSDGQPKSSFDAPSSWTLSPWSSVSQKQERRSGSYLPAISSPHGSHDVAGGNEPLSQTDWAYTDFEDDDAPPPGTAVSAPADLVTGSSIGNARYTMVLIDASNVTFPVELVVQGKRGGHAFVDNLHHMIVGQLAKHELAPITDAFMVRVVMLYGEYGNVKEGSVNLKPMEEFSLGIQSHMSSMPFEVIPSIRFNDLPSALLSALRMCLSDDDCQRVFLAADTSLPAYHDALLNLSATSNISKLLLLNGDVDTQNMGLTCLDVRDVVSSIDKIGSLVPLSTTLTRAGTDEAKWYPPAYSAVTKAASHPDLLRDHSAMSSARDSRNETTETWHFSSLPQPVTVPHMPIVHGKSAFCLK
ncbi:hypothetical protein QFC19_008459 [Naganishia cerealis]|uniref:Uncharacterized protein n=1 Tax=Naganishia cerealis TaxID=610337 RepID=A0ACC2V3A2_9TREE|nr:hypothetical protein QFC19_008459 [Naganishia cerealis]